MEMAVEHEVQNDNPAHVRDYSRFVGLMKWGTIISFIIAAIVVLLIA